ncbi:hypothetical protein GLOTRDRAFT_98271 [Gloeophyllum trabeum ATCC 11539]|uniref:Uncharacterized protein n=1 Tax=Gloeophyllum trabeum (strain ATCC 11539 / FP-39264 / Madison 617) TaxID=670483 RepID=S7QH65_GLOTA|nr:uncharacterized protein GLOTRDRAFT_98271 [Gloeophyllum trabeum ATCC 11539]EPQ59141.1 hypothetical protein GLOTRDRAFT_98271 [Gloeophyllum trabeum ATCC 11539]
MTDAKSIVEVRTLAGTGDAGFTSVSAQLSASGSHAQRSRPSGIPGMQYVSDLYDIRSASCCDIL